MSIPIKADKVMEDESHDAKADVPRQVRSGPSVSSCVFTPSDKLIARMKELRRWRIPPSWIEFVEGAKEFHGGHATVSQALSWSDYRIKVAVKKMRIADDTDLERALGLAIREAEFLVGLNHPNIIGLEGFTEDISNGIIWLIFPWAYNGTLKEFVALLDWEIPERISLINDVALGLAYLHSRKPPICHGDLKSPNVLVDQYRYAKITDLGSARRLPRRDSETQVKHIESQPRSAQPLSATFCASNNTITLTGNKYTLRWAAPELLIKDKLSLWSDIWALGWIAYEVMTDSLPFQDASTDIAIVGRIIRGELPILTENAHLSVIHELCSLMTMCWRYNPRERPTADYFRRFIKMMPMFVPEVRRRMQDGGSLTIYRLDQLGRMYQSRGEYARAFDFFMMALGGLRQLRSKSKNDTRLDSEDQEIQEEDRILKPLWNLAEECRLQHPCNEAIQLYSKISQMRPNLCDKADALCGIAGVHRFRGEYGKAVQLYSQVLDMRTSLRDRKGRADILWALADVHRHQHNYNKAILRYSEALIIFISLRDTKGRADALWGIAEVHRLRKEYEAAIPLYSQIVGISTSLCGTRARANALLALGEIHRLRYEYNEALQLYTEALKIITHPNDIRDRVNVLWGLAEVYRLRYEKDGDVPAYSEPFRWSAHCNSRRTMKGDSIASTPPLQSDYDEALSYYCAVLEFRRSLNDKQGRADALWGLAEMRRLRGEYSEAISLYSNALELCADLGDRKGKADALWGLANVHRHRYNYIQAIPLYSQSLAIRIELGERNAGLTLSWAWPMLILTQFVGVILLVLSRLHMFEALQDASNAGQLFQRREVIVTRDLAETC